MVEGRQVETVIATRMDRLSRGASETVRLSELFAEPGAPRLQLLDEPELDLTSVGGRMAMRMLGIVAAGEVERLRERSAHGKAHRKAAGRVDVAPLGLKVNALGKLEPDTAPWLCTLPDRREWSRADAVRELVGQVEAATQYAGWRWFFDTLGVDLTRAGVTRLVLNPALRGARVAGRQKNGAQASWSTVEEGLGGEPLIEPARHLALEARMRGQRARNESQDTRRTHPLTGKLVCGHCGRNLGRKLMVCGKGEKRGRYNCLNPACSWAVPGERRNSVTESIAMDAALAELYRQAPAIAAVLKGQADAARQSVTSSGEVLELQQRRQALLRLQADGALGMEAALQAVDRQLADLTAATLAATGDAGLDVLRRDTWRAGMHRMRQVYLSGSRAEIEGRLGPLPDGALEDHTTGSLVARFAAGAEHWLEPHQREYAMRWLGRFVRQIRVEAKVVAAVELNL
jgi:hypothetical protein